MYGDFPSFITTNIWGEVFGGRAWLDLHLWAIHTFATCWVFGFLRPKKRSCFCGFCLLWCFFCFFLCGVCFLVCYWMFFRPAHMKRHETTRSLSTQYVTANWSNAVHCVVDCMIHEMAYNHVKVPVALPGATLWKKTGNHFWHRTSSQVHTNVWRKQKTETCIYIPFVYQGFHTEPEIELVEPLKGKIPVLHRNQDRGKKNAQNEGFKPT